MEQQSRVQDSRKLREQRFHDETFESGSRRRLSTFYSIVAESRDYFQDRVLTACTGRDTLEYGCGMGSHSFQLARRGAHRVVGLDISPFAVHRAQERAVGEGLGNVKFTVGDAERLPFVNGAFDLVLGTSILHHLDLEASLGEIARVLKPDGMAAFIEPLGHNPAIRAFRMLTPRDRTPDEHPLTRRDLRLIRRRFREVSFRHFHLTTLLVVPFHRAKIFAPWLRAAARFDRLLFDTIPPLRSLSWQVVMFLGSPAK